jgi:hypothetical protein
MASSSSSRVEKIPRSMPRRTSFLSPVRAFQHARTPCAAEFLVARGIRNQTRHDAFLQIGFAGRRFVDEITDQVSFQVAGVDIGRAFVELVDMDQDFHAQGILVRPMLVDGGFADAGSGSNGIHAGGVNSVFREQFESAFENLLVRALAEAAGTSGKRPQAAVKAPGRYGTCAGYGRPV